MKEGYLILSAGLGGDFGSCSLINKEIWDLLNHTEDLHEISDELYEDLFSVLEVSDRDEFLAEFQYRLEVQEFHCLLGNISYCEKAIMSAKYFRDLHSMVKYVKDNDIEVIDTIY